MNAVLNDYLWFRTVGKGGGFKDVTEPQHRRKGLQATAALAVAIEEASAKIQTGLPGDEKDNCDLPVWADVPPVQQEYGVPEADLLL